MDFVWEIDINSFNVNFNI